MPFVPPLNRDKIHLQGPSACESVGDLCFVFYEHIMKAWIHEPRWRTAHRLYDLFADPIENEFFTAIYNQVETKFELKDVFKAAGLAYHVFFQLHIIPYEIQQREKNGDIYG